ncbi:MAG TPA: proton-conducting transporter membrane subunit, partial [Bacteroidia bacterium]|nr:proton-conducting transporter membrane subunit [Bacteroidia bacterium]
MKDIITQVAGLVPLFPLIGFLIISLLNKRLSKDVASMIACGALFASFVVSVILFINVPPAGIEVHIADWINAGTFSASFSFLIDPLSCIFLLIITGVGFLIHVYSIGYMHDDDNQNIFFSYLNLFIFFMLMLVMGSSYLLMFVGWEGVGLCSYLLIGFWFVNNDYTDAAKKAFIMNRIGDLGFLLALFWLLARIGTVNYADVFSAASIAKLSATDITGITLLLFLGAT